MRVEGFKKEFQTKLNETYGQEKKVKTTDLDLNAVNSIVYQLGFLQRQSSNEQQNQFDDIYTLLKVHKDQSVGAKNLETVLLVISGERDETQECQNDIDNKKWMTAGVYE